MSEVKTMKYNNASSLLRRKVYEEIGKTRNNTVFTDLEIIKLLDTLDIAIGFHDGIEGSNSLTGTALIALHYRLLGIARMRNIVTEA